MTKKAKPTKPAQPARLVWEGPPADILDGLENATKTLGIARNRVFEAALRVFMDIPAPPNSALDYVCKAWAMERDVKAIPQLAHMQPLAARTLGAALRDPELSEANVAAAAR